MSEMIERVAVALAKTNGGDFYDPKFYTEEQRNVWRSKARDGIEAMREPTEAMTAAAFKWANDSGFEVYPGSDYAPMIDAALSN